MHWDQKKGGPVKGEDRCPELGKMRTNRPRRKFGEESEQ